MSWFETLAGFKERSYEETRRNFRVEEDRLISLANGKQWGIGKFEMVSLADLRSRVANKQLPVGKPRLSIVSGEVGQKHAQPEFAGALFQVASQFNALEMSEPSVNPEDGITRYQFDRTQGPACAIAAGAATIYRNYFVPVGDSLGQTKARQLDGLAEMGNELSRALDRPISELWMMKNGYALCTAEGVERICAYLRSLSDVLLDDLSSRLRIGVHSDVQITLRGASKNQFVTQAFCAALPIAYCDLESVDWAPFATFILEAAYEATLLAGALNASAGRSNVILLTLLGGGSFGNDRHWIENAIHRAFKRVDDRELDVRIVCHGNDDAAFCRERILNISAAR